MLEQVYNFKCFQVQSLLLANTRHILEGGVLREHYDISSMERRIKDRLLIQPRPIFEQLSQVCLWPAKVD